MIKAELRKLRTLNATKEMVEKAKKGKGQNYKRSYYYSKNNDATYRLYMRAQNLGPYIKAAIFDAKNLCKDITTPIYEVYINIEGKEYITRKLDDSGNEVGWTKAMIHNLKYPGEWGCSCFLIWMDSHQASHIGKLLGNEKKGDAAIYKFQQDIKADALAKARERQTAPWDADNNLVPKELPKGFEKWWQKKVITEHYLFYKDKEDDKGYCSYCEQDVDILDNPRHNKKTKCSNCGHKVQYKHLTRFKYINGDRKTTSCFQPVKGGVVLRVFDVQTCYNFSNKDISTEPYKKPRHYINEHRRIFRFEDDTVRSYDWYFYKNITHRWCSTQFCNYSAYFYWNLEGKRVYTGNLRCLNKIHTSIPTLLRKGYSFNLAKLMYEEVGNPLIEQCVKIGAIKLGIDLLDSSYYKVAECIDQEATELTKSLLIDKMRLKRLVTNNGNLIFLRWLQQEKIDNTIFDELMIKAFSENDILPGDLFEVRERMTYQQIYNYLSKNIQGNEKLSNVWQRYEDYMQMAEKAGMATDNIMVYKPSNLSEAHVEVIKLLEKADMEKEAKKVEEKFPLVNEVCKTLDKYEWSDGEYMVVAPKCVMDIVEEGTILKHCIHRVDYYMDRMEQKETFSLFLRKCSAPTVPWYSMEVEPSGNIRQKRTVHDTQGKDLDAAIPFLKKWQKVIKERLDEEDIKLAKISNEKRIDNYKEIRKEQKKVWHGVLAGKLLADVLEADFLGVDDIAV